MQRPSVAGMQGCHTSTCFFIHTTFIAHFCDSVPRAHLAGVESSQPGERPHGGTGQGVDARGSVDGGGIRSTTTSIAHDPSGLGGASSLGNDQTSEGAHIGVRKVWEVWKCKCARRNQPDV